MSLLLLSALILHSCSLGSHTHSDTLQEGTSARTEPQDVTTASDNSQFGLPISTDNVQYCGWQDYVTDGTYVIAAEGFQTGVIAKYHLETGSITTVCLKEGCQHPLVSFENLPNENCPIPLGSSLYFIHNNKVYFKYSITCFDEKELEETGSTQVLKRWVFASYDYITGEKQTILETEPNGLEKIYTFKLVGEYIYYLRDIAQVEAPTTKEDYAHCLCRMRIDEYQEEILFDLSKAFPDYPIQAIPMVLAIDNQTVYFVCNITGNVFFCSLSGENGEYLINAEKEGFWGIYDAFGTFYLDGYIYFAKYVQEPLKAVCLYKMNAATGEKSILTSDYLRWFFVTDHSIYYEMSQVMQPGEAQRNEAGEIGSYRYTIKQMNLDGTDAHVIGHIDAPHAETARPWAVGCQFFIQMRWKKNISATQSIMGHYDVIFDVTNGNVIEIGKSDELLP